MEKYKGFEDIVERVFKGRLRAGHIDPGLTWEQFSEIWKGVEKGFGIKWHDVDYSTSDGRMLEMLRENVFVFSACKNYQELKELSAKLLDKNGQLRSFADFRTEALKVHEVYNKAWLEAEYNHAVASSQMASRWNEIQRDKAVLPYLRFNAVMDDRTTSTCSSLNGVIKPVDDPIWNSFYPPNHWGCRSTVDQLDRGKVTPDEKVKLPDIPPMFRNNVGKDGIVFPKKHPYYTVQREHAKGLARAIDKAKTDAGIFTPAKTLKEAEEFAVRNALAPEVSYRGLSVEVANDVNRSLLELKKLTGKTFNRVLSRSFQGKTSLINPMATRYAGNFSLEINSKFFKQFASLDDLSRDIMKMHEKGWWIPRNVEGLVYHEFGHLLTMRKTIGMSPMLRRISYSDGISEYAKTDLDETLAEIFAKFVIEGKQSLKEEWIHKFNVLSDYQI